MVIQSYVILFQYAIQNALTIIIKHIFVLFSVLCAKNLGKKDFFSKYISIYIVEISPQNFMLK